VFGTKEILEKYDFSYTDNYNLPKAVKTTASTADSYETNSLYAFEDSSATALNTAELRQIKIEDTQLKNNKIVSKTRTTYAQNSNTSNLVLPISVSSYDIGSGVMIPEISYDQLDSKGNILQYTPKNGNPVTVIWGYNQTLPIAKIEGAFYNDVKNNGAIMAAISASLEDASQGTEASEQQLVAKLEDLRSDVSISKYKLTTYSYDLLVGIRSITPPSGIKQYFNYDNTNRLQKILDVNKNIINEYQYNFKP
jgi:AMMECR1 domain-containing protein